MTNNDVIAFNLQEEQPLYHIIDNSADSNPDNIAVDFLGKIYTYADLQSQVDFVARGLQENGVTKNTRVGLFLPNCPQFIISYFAVLKAGGIVVNFSPLYSNSELKYQVEDSGIEILITLNLKLLYPKAKLLIGTANLKKIIVSDMQSALPMAKKIAFSLFKRKEISPVKYDDSSIKWSDLFSYGVIKKSDIPKTNPKEDVAVLQYTGGTTGTPKGAMLTHHNIYSNAQQVSYLSKISPKNEDSVIGVLPFFHVFAMTTIMNMGLLSGIKLIIHPRFELKHLLKDIDRKKPTLMPGVPTMYTAINNYPQIDKFNLSSLRACISGGAPLAAQVKEKFEEISGCVLIEGYGLTESSPVLCANPLDGVNKTGSIGLPLPETEIIIDEDYLTIDKSMTSSIAGGKSEATKDHNSPHKIGEICAKAPQVMKGYWNNESATKEVLQDGLLRTGDVGYVDEDGYVFIVDRIKELIIAGGFNIYPRNVEDAIYKHPAVEEVAVIGIDDVYRGQTVKAFIALKKDAKLEAAELKIFLKEHLGKHEIPTHIEFRTELPKTMIGKISKKDL